MQSQSLPRKSEDLEAKKLGPSFKETVKSKSERFFKAHKDGLTALVVLGVIALIFSGMALLWIAKDHHEATVTVRFQNQLRAGGYNIVVVTQLDCSLHTEYTTSASFLAALNPSIKTVYLIYAFGVPNGYLQMSANNGCIGVNV